MPTTEANMTATIERAEQGALDAYEEIQRQAAALTLDWDRFQELKAKRRRNPDEREEWAELKAAAGRYESYEQVRCEVEEEPLSLEVRSDWGQPGDLAPGEYSLLLATGGPALRLTGDLDRGEPCTARLEYQDWFTPWTPLNVHDMDDALLTYARVFYYGE